MTRNRKAAGAVASQFSQAGASFFLSVAGIRSLGAADYGVLALLLGFLVVATALMTGFVGDSLTILDRQQHRIRAALEMWGAIIALVLLVVGAVISYATGLLGPAEAVLFGLALTAFTVEDCARRLLMATLRFWHVVAIDVVYLLVAAAVLGTIKIVTGGLEVGSFLLALILGQVLATAVGVVLLPGSERRFARWTGAALREVAGFGTWRAVQQCIRPGALTLVRLLVVAAAGSAALGHLEAARVYMSPTLLLAQGAGSFLLATYAVDRNATRRRALQGSDRAAAILVGLSVAVGIVAVVALPWLGALLSGGGARIDPLAAAAWGCYAACAAAGMPYISLASVRSPQRTVVGLRFTDTAVSVLLAAVVLFALGATPSVVPFAMGVGILLGAGLQRWVALSSSHVLPRPVGVSAV